VEFGLGLRALRSVGVRRLAARQKPAPGALVLSKSQLDRYERGALPPLQYARHLDTLYEAEGWVEMSIRSLWRPRWNPWTDDHGTARRIHAGRWPAQYGGLVWIKVKPQPEWVSHEHVIELEWGPWQRRITCVLEADGAVLATGKATDDDGISRTCNLTSEPALYALYGAGEYLSGETVLDVRRGWSMANPDAGPTESQYGPQRAE
jgi:hypothetical protein